MDEKFTALFTQWLEADMASKTKAAEVEAQKAAESAPAYVTADALKGLFESFSAEVSKAITAAVEAAQPVRSEGAGRAAADVQKSADANPIAVIAAKLPSELTREDKELKAAIVRYVAAKA